MSDEDLKAELERLKVENERLKNQRGRSSSLKVSETGRVCLRSRAFSGDAYKEAVGTEAAWNGRPENQGLHQGTRDRAEDQARRVASKKIAQKPQRNQQHHRRKIQTTDRRERVANGRKGWLGDAVDERGHRLAAIHPDP